jgi:autotransporter-associated beta strand protein
MNKQPVTPNTMKTKTEQMDSFNSFNCLTRLVAAMVLAALSAAPSAFAASGTWTNAPASGSWTNVLNWNGGTVPGTINNTGNNGVDTASIANFTNAIPGSLIGSASSPVIPDDATVANGKARMLYQLNFNGATCGSYVFYSPSAYAAQTATTPETGVLSLCDSTANGGANGSYIGAAVVNPQTFLIPVQIRLPSSTTGTYGFTNNATSPNATYYFNQLFLYPGATGRGVTFVFSGSNTGTNTVASLAQSANQTGAPSGIRKEGSGTWILSGANTFAAASSMLVTAGTLIVKDPAAFGSATSATVNSNGVLQIDGVALTQMYLTLNSGGTIRMNGTAGLNGLALGSQSGNSGTVRTTSASDVFTIGSGIAVGAYVTGGAADTVLSTAGPGTLVFGQANTYIGKWSFGAATNQISNASALGTGQNANVGVGAILDLTPLGDTTFAPTTSGFGGSGTGTTLGSTAAAVLATAGSTVDLTGKAVNLTFTPTGFSGDTAHPALYLAQGTLSLSGNTFFVNNASGTALRVGTYRLIQQASGSVSSGGGYAVLVSGSGLASDTTAEIQVSGGNVDLVIALYVPKDLVWTGGNPDTTWNVNSTSNFLNGASRSVFNNSDNVSFNSIGSTNPSVALSGTLAPASVTVDSSANDYTFAGPGQIGGTTALKKLSTGTLLLQTAHSYAGGTVVSNGVLRYGVNNAVSSTGNGDVAVYNGGVVDLNNYNGTINGLNGDGAVDNQGGSASALTLGNNDASGSFSGVVKNTSGTLAVTKIGSGTQSLTASNAYTGATTISAGTLAAVNAHALGPVSDLTISAGTLDVRTPRLYLNSLAGSGGTIANNSTTTTNTLVIQGTSSTTFSGSMVDGSSGQMALLLLGGTLRLNAANTFTGGSTVASGATLALGNSPASLAGFVVVSNSATLNLAGSSSIPGTPASITTVDGATALFTSAAEGNTWGGQFLGSATTTNRFLGASTAGGALSFSNFLGVVQLAMNNASNPNFRFNNAIAGGDSTTFEFESGLVHTRDSQTVRLGAIRGGSSTCGIGGTTTAGQIGTWLIGGKNTDSAFHGYITWSNNLVKIGSGSLTLDGIAYYTNTVTLPDPYEATNIVSYTLRSNLITYFNWTTVSNGILKIVAPNQLTNSSGITLAGAGAILDVSEIGYATNQTTLDYNAVEQPTNTVIVVTKTLDLVGSQSLLGNGTIRGSLNAAATTTVAPGFSTGTLTITDVATLNGAVNMELNRTASPNCDHIVAASFAGSGATLTVTNIGATLVTGDTFQLFSGPVNAFATVNLPVASADNSITYGWTNMLAVNGSVKVLSGASPVDTTPTNITAVYSGNTLQLSWPTGQTGWELQTNAVDVTKTNYWFVYPGSTGTNQVTVTVDLAKPNVFYRLHLQYTP